MTKYFRTNLEGAHPRYPIIGPLTGGKFANRSRVEAVVAAQDLFPATGRRVVMSQSMCGAETWLVPNTDPHEEFDPDDPVTPVPDPGRSHPPPGVARVVARSKFALTPGCFLRLDVLAAPSGGTQFYRNVSGDDYYDGQVGGSLRLVVNWYAQDTSTETTTTDIQLRPSLDGTGGAVAGEGLFSQLRRYSVPLIVPDDIQDAATLRRWCQHTLCEATLYHVGGVRIVDAVVSEVPYQFAMEGADDAGYWVAHGWGSNNQTSGPDLTYPYESFPDPSGETDPTGGTHHLMNVHHAAWNRLGPALIYWTAWHEDTASVGSNSSNAAADPPRREFTGLTWQRIDGAATHVSTVDAGYDATEPGWSIACGAYSRRLADHPTESMGNNGAIPVWVDAFVAFQNATAGRDGYLRIQASPYSWIELFLESDVVGTSGRWVSKFGWLRCGKGPGDPSVVQCFGRITNVFSRMYLYHLQVTRAGTYARPTGSV